MCSILDVYSVCTLWLTTFICGSLHLQHINWDKLYKKELEPLLFQQWFVALSSFSFNLYYIVCIMFIVLYSLGISINYI